MPPAYPSFWASSTATAWTTCFRRAYNNGWYTNDSQYLNTALSSLLTEALTLRTTLEPFRDFNIQLDARKNAVSNRQVFYRR